MAFYSPHLLGKALVLMHCITTGNSTTHPIISKEDLVWCGSSFFSRWATTIIISFWSERNNLAQYYSFLPFTTVLPSRHLNCWCDAVPGFCTTTIASMFNRGICNPGTMQKLLSFPLRFPHLSSSSTVPVPVPASFKWTANWGIPAKYSQNSVVACTALEASCSGRAQGIRMRN